MTRLAPLFPANMIKAKFTALVSIITFAGLSFAAPVSAQISQADAEGFTQTLVTQLSQIAQDGALDDQAQDRAYRQALQSRLANESIGSFLFKGIPEGLPTSAQKETYNQLFPNYIAAAFAAQIGGLAERQINITESRARGDDEVIVRSELVNDAGVKKASIDWRIRDINGQPHLLDVLVERSSPLVTKRQEFSSLAEREGVEALLEHMRSIAQ